jgi:N-sulfoglucosamine sulfohydrolase
MHQLRFSLLPVILIFTLLFVCKTKEDQANPPNILWISIEDLTPMIGCYGDPLAETPTIDSLASVGVKFTNAFATAAVCSPARSAIITGMYATSLGTQHLRSETVVPDAIPILPSLLKEAGYYCSNNYKEDYNFDPVNAWNESSKNAHWRGRKEGQPFFAVFNLETTHQSQIFGSDSLYEKRFEKYLPVIERTDPNAIKLPSYYFDSPLIRKLWARYYDNVKIVDLQIKEILDQLKSDGLADNTIVFFFSDHGTGMPRGKRALYDSGLKVPFIVAAPEWYQKTYGLEPGTSIDRLISFVDFAPTVLNMLGQPIPAIMQGLPFLGASSDKENEFVYATSDRVDEAYEVVRSVRTKRFRYIRNFLPQLPLIQPNYYSDKSAINQELYRILAATPELTPAQQSMWQKKRPVEELYDTQSDPDETHNLAGEAAHGETLKKLRAANRQVMIDINDSGLTPEAYMYRISAGSTPYEALADTNVYPLSDLLNMIEKEYGNDMDQQQLLSYLTAEKPLFAYWTMIYLQYQDNLKEGVKDKLLSLTKQKDVFLAITAAETLAQFGLTDDSLPVLANALNSENPNHLLMAARAIELLGAKAAPIQDEVKSQWVRLQKATKDKWKGYDLYASWGLNEVFEK